MTDWKQIKNEYVAGGVSYRALAERYGIAYGTLAERAGREGWVELKKQNEALSRGTLPCEDPAYEAQTQEKTADVMRIADKLLLRLSELLDVMVLDTQGLKQIASVLKDIRDVKESPLESALQRARIRKLEREAEAEDEGAREITVVFRAGSEAWNE